MSLATRHNHKYELDLWTKEEMLKEVKSLCAPKLTNAEFETFVQIGRSTGLNPFLREIWAVKYNNSAAIIFVGRDGYRKSAQSSPDYDYHQVDAVYENDLIEFDQLNGCVNHKFSINNRGVLKGAYCLVKRKKSSRPSFTFVEFQEYNLKQSQWLTKPATMIKKVAEAQGLRMTFQELFAGTYHESENWMMNKKEYNEPIYAEILENKVDHKDLLYKFSLAISWASDLDDLQNIFKAHSKEIAATKDRNVIDEAIRIKDKRKEELFKKDEVIDIELGEIE